PLFVMTDITPLPAREPYSAAAAAPLTTSMDSISSTLISERLPVRIIPSTKINGEELVLKLLSPLNSRSAPWPGFPLTDEVFKPATLPAKAEAAEVAGTTFNCSAETLVTDTVIFFLEVAPATPVTI